MFSNCLVKDCSVISPVTYTSGQTGTRTNQKLGRSLIGPTKHHVIKLEPESENLLAVASLSLGMLREVSKELYRCLLPRVAPRFLGRPACSLVSVSTDPSRCCYIQTVNLILQLCDVSTVYPVWRCAVEAGACAVLDAECKAVTSEPAHWTPA